MSEELQVVNQESILTVDQIKAQRNVIVQVMKSVMTQDIHYGIIPGTQKPTIFKPGCEVLLSTFRISIEPVVTDLSNSDEIKYRVECRGSSMISGNYLGSGVGECSSSEEKYKWRKAVCPEEFNATMDDRRRKKWAKGKEGKAYAVDQVRTNPSDVANTILKMAKKRGISDFCLTVLAASEIFNQDYEDIPEEIRESISDDAPQPIKQPARQSSTPAASNNPPPSGDCISEPQRKRLYAIYKNAGITDEQMKDYLFREFNVEHTKDIKRNDYETICEWASKHSEPGANG
jgi:hypothetical protein